MSEDEKLVPFDRGRRKPDPAKVAEFAATARKLQQEREASGVVATLLRDTPYGEWPQLRERGELQNSGALERLSTECVDRLQKNPRESLTIADLEIAIANVLPHGMYPVIVMAQLRAHAWKDRGRALCHLAQYPLALNALDHAEEILAPFGTLAHDRAIVRLVRASTLQEIQRYDETLGVLRECKQIFLDHGDARRHLICGIIEGNLLHRMGLYREAREAYLPLLDLARSGGDRESLASIHNNIGYSSVEMGDFNSAETHLGEAIAILQEMNEPLRVARAELARGRLYVRRGDVERGISHLHEIRDQFLRHGLVEEAGLCGLEVVEALLIRSRTAEAEQLARRIIHEFTAAQLSARAITALGYLSETIAARSASASTAQHVRQYIHSLRKEPEREFVATA